MKKPDDAQQRPGLAYVAPLLGKAVLGQFAHPHQREPLGAYRKGFFLPKCPDRCADPCRSQGCDHRSLGRTASYRSWRHPFRLFRRLLSGTMSRSYKISLILKSRSSLPVYKDLAKLSDRELDEHVLAMIRRMRANESGVIARMVLRQPTFSLN
jgi:hypothetical protein